MYATHALSIVAIVFFVMGVLALVTPDQILGYVGITRMTPDARNEVRAVYGGFGVAIAALLVFAISNPSIRPGVCLTVSVALLGMAAGRLVSRMMDGHGSTITWSFCGGEVAMASLLVYVLAVTT